MKDTTIKSVLLNIEVWIQVILWALFFATINVNWTSSWISESFLPESVAPHIALIIPIMFLLNVYWLIPKFLNKTAWVKYIWLSISLLISFEIIRALIFTIGLQNSESILNVFKDELFGENSLVFGLLNVIILNMVFYSFVYRFTRDWIINKNITENLKLQSENQRVNGLQLAGSSSLNFIDSEAIKLEPKVLKETFTIKKRDGVILLKVDQILYFQAQGDFVLAFDNNNNKHIVNESLKLIKGQICEKLFFQINRSEIVNFNYISKFNSYTKNRLEITLKNNQSLLYTSNSRTPEFRSWIEQH